MSTPKSLPGIGNQWEIALRAPKCSRSGVEFEDGESFYTLLFDSPEGFRREDLSEAAWKEFCEQGEDQPFSFWKSKFQLPPAEPEETMPARNAETLLRKWLADGPAPEYENACYILALMLERKRTLRQVDSKKNGGNHLLIYEHAKTGEAFIVKDPQLHLEQIEDVQREVSVFLEGGMPAASSAA